MNITWVVLDDITPGLKNLSTYNRVSLVVPYMPDTIICSTDEVVKECDVIIYQDRFELHDVYLATELKKQNKKILIDISFPVWNSKQPNYNPIKAKNFFQLAELSSCIIVPSSDYQSNLEHYIADKQIKVIPTRFDFGIQLNKNEFNKLSSLREFNVEQSAKEYMNIIYEITESNTIWTPEKQRKETKEHYQDIRKCIKFVGNKSKHVHIRDVRDGWIMQVFGDELAQLNDRSIKFTSGRAQDFNADINYYINWTNDKPCLNELEKTKCDIILFTHFEHEHFVEETRVMEWSDLFTCMSKHGEMKLKERGILAKKISIIEGIGTSTKVRKKIAIGWAGRPYFHLGRKNYDAFIKLSEDLDKEIFKFIFYGRRSGVKPLAEKMEKNGMTVEILGDDYDYFLKSIDYYLSPSDMEGGPMDMLNAIYAGVPVIAQDVGFFHTLKTKEDFKFKNYKELLKFFKLKEKSKKKKIKIITPYTWDNFRLWHIKYFRKVLGLNEMDK